jgi:hypothetical protein
MSKEEQVNTYPHLQLEPQLQLDPQLHDIFSKLGFGGTPDRCWVQKNCFEIA